MKSNRLLLTKAFTGAVLGAAVLTAGCVRINILEGNGPEIEVKAHNKASSLPAICFDKETKINKIDLSSLRSSSDRQFFRQSYAKRQYLLYGDTDHYDKRIHDGFWSGNHLDFLAAQDVKHIFIERAPSTSKKGLDDLMSGAITPLKFAQDYVGGKLWESSSSHESRVKMAQGVVYAASLGIKVHASDIKTKGIATKREREELYKFYGDMSAEFNKACPGVNSISNAFFGRYMKKNEVYLQENNRGQRFGQIMQERYNDANRVHLIQSIAGTDKSAIIYGAAHFSGPKSIKTLLGAQNTVHIDLFADEKKLHEYGLKPGGGTDFAYVLDQNKLYQFGTLPICKACTIVAKPTRRQL